jgi:hypothetical protein
MTVAGFMSERREAAWDEPAQSRRAARLTAGIERRCEVMVALHNCPAVNEENFSPAVSRITLSVLKRIDTHQEVLCYNDALEMQRPLGA